MRFRATIVFEECWNAINEMADRTVFDTKTRQTKIIPGRKYKLIEQVGGSRSSKTWSDFQIIYLYASSHRNKTIIVLRDTAADCRDKVETEWRDWLRDPMLRIQEYERDEIDADKLDALLKEEDLSMRLKENRTNHSWTFPSGSVITFTGVDDEDKAIGKAAHVVWVNEPYKFPESVFKQLYMRVKDFMIWDWNPKQGHYIETKRLEPDTFVHRSNLTMNPFCPVESRRMILGYQPIKLCELVVSKELEEATARSYDCAVNPNSYPERQIKELFRCQENERKGSASEYDWLVYGLGEKAERPNRIFRWIKIPRAKYDAIEAVKYYGNDWGKVDPWGISEWKYYDGALYARELNYLSENQIREQMTISELTAINEEDKAVNVDEIGSVGIVSWMYNRLKIPKNAVVVCDSNRPGKIAWLRRCGWSHAVPASKVPGSIIDGIELLSDLTVYYTDDSPNIEHEQENYSYKVDRYGVTLEEPEDVDNHHMDPARYVAQYLRAAGVIKVR